MFFHLQEHTEINNIPNDITKKMHEIHHMYLYIFDKVAEHLKEQRNTVISVDTQI